MKRKAIITGGMGFVGQHLHEQLVGAGWDVIIVDLALDTSVLDYEYIRCLLEHEEPDAVFHLAAQAYVAESVVDPNRAMQVNLHGTETVLRALRAIGSQAHVLITGTSEEYGYETQPADVVTELSPGLPSTVYGASKLAATALGQAYHYQYGMHVVCSRAWNHTGPGQASRYALPAFARRIVRAELTGEAIQVGNLDAIRNYTDVRDVVAAYILLIDAEPGVYNVANPMNTAKMSVFLDMMCEHARRPIAVMENERLWRPSHSMKFPEPDISKICKLTEWRPRISMKTTLQDLLTYWRNQP